jgi:hypothetical protein
MSAHLRKMADRYVLAVPRVLLRETFVFFLFSFSLDAGGACG